MADQDLRVKKQVQKYVKRAHDLMIKHKRVFKNNSLAPRELESFANRYLGGLEEKPVVAAKQTDTTKKKYTTVEHNKEAFANFNIPEKKTAVVAEDETGNMTVDQLKELAHQMGISTRGMTRKADIQHIIDQHRKFGDEEVNEEDVNDDDELPEDDEEEIEDDDKALIGLDTDEMHAKAEKTTDMAADENLDDLNKE